MINWYDELLKDTSDVRTASSDVVSDFPSSGIDAFLQSEEQVSDADLSILYPDIELKPVQPERVRIASSQDLSGFSKISSNNTLVRHSEKDLWRLAEDEDGVMYIERLYDTDGSPLKI